MTLPPLTWLYVPGSRPDRFARAAASGADVVIVDLEDAVHPTEKKSARANVVAFLADRPAVPIEVRINGVSTPWCQGDLDALRPMADVVEIRLPKVRSVADVIRVPDCFRVHCLIEDAQGLEHIAEVAASRARSLALGEADLRSDLGVGNGGLYWARCRIVLASRAHGLAPPAMSVYPRLHDDRGLTRHCRLGGRLGFVGAAAIHPDQLPVIDAAFRPTAGEVASARSLLDSLADAGRAGRATTVRPDGSFADPAMTEAARRTIALADRAPFGGR